MTATVLVLALISIGYAVVDVVLSLVRPAELQSFACIPIAWRKRFHVHASHFVGDVPIERPISYRDDAAERQGRVDPIAFPNAIDHSLARLVPLDGGMSAMVLADSATSSRGTAVRIDAIVGPGRDLRLVARVTPFICVVGVVVPIVLALSLGVRGLIAGGFATAAAGYILVRSRDAAAWAFDATARRLERPREGGT